MNFAKRFKSISDPTVSDLLKLTESPGIISFAGGTPSADALPYALIKKILPELEIDLQYTPTQGIKSLRERLAKIYSDKWNSKITPDQILITSGSQQALDLIAKVFINKGDKVFVENLTYFVALYAFNAYEPKYQSISAEKISGEEKLSGKLIYLVSNFQNPTGKTISEIQRRNIANAVIAKDLILIEDDPYGELFFSDCPPKPIALLAPENTIYLTSVSKIMGPALRLGIAISTPETIQALTRAKTGMDLCTSGLLQQLAGKILIEPKYQDHLIRIRKFYAGKCGAMLSALKKHMPDSVSWTKPEGGLFIWMELPDKIDTAVLYKKALTKGAAFVPGYIFSPTGKLNNCLRLSFASPTLAEINTGIATLANLIKSNL
ncbi:PLP-dependent aminotransferase family protein [Candidatus Collierbacteria bacterium]|nr:PLP-dependent aminotransferase family protein [Candidatus Collierbacteria bacterium]